MLPLIAALLVSGCAETVSRDGVSWPEGYSPIFDPAPHNFMPGFANAGAPVRRGALSEKFELRDGDCGGSDCGNPRARAEIALDPAANPARVGEDIWYGWSFYNESVPEFRRRESLRLVFGQWTMGGTARPVIRLIQLGRDEGNWDDCPSYICTGPEIAHGDVVVQLEDIRHTFGWGDAANNGQICRLFDSQDMRGKWVDLVMNTDFSNAFDGYLRIWVNGELKCDYRGPVVSLASLQQSETPGHRRGVFSSYTKRWDDTRQGQAKPTLVVYYDEFRIGKKRADVDVALLQAIGQPPLD